MNNQQKTPDEDSMKQTEFWGKFTLFPSKFANDFYGSFWYLSLLAILPFLARLIPIVWIWILLAIGLIFVIWAYVRWQAKIPLVFRWLIDNQRITNQSGDSESRYQRYLEDYQKELHTKWKRYILVIIFGILILLYRVYSPKMPLNFLLVFLLWGLLMSIGVWPIYVTGKYVRMLSREFDIAIQPVHPDKCGGLKPLGDFCLAMALPLIIGELVLAIYGIGGALLLPLYPNHVIASGSVIYTESDVIFANIALFLIALPFTLVSFLRPLWEIHIYMVNYKTKAEDEFASRALRLEQQIRKYLDQEGMLEKARIAKDQMEIMQVIHPNTLRYPTWPFSRDTLLKLISPQLLGVISTMISVYQSITTLFAAW